VKREAQGVLLFVLGGAVLHASLTGLYLRYVRAGLRPFLLIAGVVLIIAAIATLWYELRPSARKAAAADHDDDGHGNAHAHAHREPRIAWLLLLPLLALIVVAPPALGSYASDRTGTALQKPFGFPNLPADNPLELTVQDYATRAVFDHGRDLTGRQVKITGFIGTNPDGTPYLSRMMLNCCAADALPIKVALAGPNVLTLRRDAWYTLTGTYSPKALKDPVNGRAIPFINVTVATPISAPEDEYEE
jgi:uncharacterized repeat protein (TIGR03943 family)